MHKITTKITFISTALSLLIMGIIGISLFLSVKDKQDAQTINTAGYERMLTQRITKQTFYALTQENPDFTDVERSLTQFKQNLHDLRYGNDARGIYAAPTKNIAKELELIAQSAIEFEKQVLHLQTLIQNLSGQHKELHTLTKNVSKTLETLKEPKNYASMQFYINHIAYHALHYFYDNSLETYQHIYNAFQKFDLLINQAHFESTLPAKSKQKIEALYQNWQRYATLITSLVETTNTIYKAKELLAHSNMALLNNIDLSVSHYTEYAETKKDFFQILQVVTGIVALILIGMAIYFVYSINHHFKTFLAKSEELTHFQEFQEDQTGGYQTVACRTGDELDTAENHINTFLFNINQTLQSARQAIAESSEAAQKLSQISEEMEDQVGSEQEELSHFIDKSEDIAIQSLEDLSATAKLLDKLQVNLNNVMYQAKK